MNNAKQSNHFDSSNIWLYYHAYSFRNFTGQIWYVIFQVKFTINVYTPEYGILYLLSRVTVDFDI